MFNMSRTILFFCIGFTFFLVWIYSFVEISFVPYSSSSLKDQLNASLLSKNSQKNYVLSSLSLSSKNESIQTWNDSTSSKTATENNTFILASQKLPLILAYDKFWEKQFFNQKVLEGLQMCKFKCEYSENQTLYPEADVAIFHLRDFSMDSMLWTNKNPNRLNVFFSIEPLPYNAIPEKRIPKDSFNVTITFRKDSTLWRPYDKFEEIQPHEKDNDTLVWNDKQVDEMISKKNKTAVVFISHCKTHSRREKYLSELKKYINFTSHGSCYNQSANYSDNMMKTELDKHYFYLAFENSVCKDYVTEKVWRIKDLIVPVVLKRSILEGIVENEYFIAADDFKTPKELAEKLMNLTQNLDEYKKYLGWTKKYKKTKYYAEVTVPNIASVDHWSTHFCKLCEMATKKEKHQIKDIYQWWKNDAKCEANFASKLLH